MKIVTEKLDLRDTRDSRMGMVLILVFAEDTGAIQLMKEKGVISTEMIDSETMKISINRNELKKLEDEENDRTATNKSSKLNFFSPSC